MSSLGTPQSVLWRIKKFFAIQSRASASGEHAPDAGQTFYVFDLANGDSGCDSVSRTGDG